MAKMSGQYYKSLAPLLLWNQIRRPVDWPGVFGRTGPIEVEIGYGNGDMLVKRALDRPDVDLLGIEITWASTKRALRRLWKNGIGNVRLVQLDARVVFERLIRPRSLQAVYALFPIPWPKDKHERRRLFSTDFLRLVSSRLENGGVFQIVTDDEPYFEWIMTQVPDTGFQAQWRLTGPRYETKYEQKWCHQGQQDFYELLLTKIEHPDVPLREDLPLQTYHLVNFDPEHFSPQDMEGPLTVKFKDFLYDPKREKCMIRTFIAEDRLIQEVWLRVDKENGQWRVALAAGNHIIPTQGIKKALELAVESCR